MPRPSTRGRPSDWHVAKQSPGSAISLRRRRVLNEQKRCQCPDCSRLRYGVSRYCHTHRRAASTRGDPLSRLPSRNELLIFKKAAAVYLQVNPKFSRKVSEALQDLERSKSLPPAFCLAPADIHAKLPQVAKATGLLANWYHKEKRSYTDAVLHALALMGWMDVYYDGLPENREAFLRTRAGVLLGDFRKTVGNQYLTKEVSGAVHRRLGIDFVRHAKQVYGSGFWSSPVSTPDGQSMTILTYTRAALRVAKLL